MRLKAKLALVATIAAACVVQSCAQPSGHLIETDIVPTVFLRKAGAWALSSAQPAFPYNSEPVLETMFGAGGEAPFGCGLTAVRNGYFSGPRGGLACATRAADGRLELRGVQRGAHFARVYDAVPLQDGFLIVVKPFGVPAARTIFLDSDGEVQGTFTLPGSAPDEAVVLPSGRIALLHNEGASCNWTILERGNADFRPVATAPEDRSLCHLSSFNGEALRDQMTGQAYLRSRRPEPNALYRIDDNGPRSPSTLVAADFGADVAPNSNSGASYVTIHGGAVYFSYPTQSGPTIGRYDLGTGETTRTVFTAPSGSLHDAEQVYGFAIAKTFGSSPHVALMNRAGETRVAALNP
ncbi:hypothetical protein [Brevundimonas sp.]|uniref:hypothetical protein n=1 Tax=Brevundimonas sp. TaxID=1871086 RepID=UPI003564A83B